MDRLGRRTGAVVVAALLASAVAADVAVAAKAKPPPKHGPDLVIKHIKVSGLGSHPVLVVNSDGEAQSFHVTVITRNAGDRTAPASITKIELRDRFGNPIARGTDKVPRLAPDETFASPGTVTSVKPHLGFVTVVAIANGTEDVPETKPHNDLKVWGQLPVIAKLWKVSKLKTDLVSPLTGEGSMAEAFDNFTFTYRGYDPTPPGRFMYTAGGGMNQNTEFDTAGCSGTGSGGALHAAWPTTSFLGISQTLTQYLAVVAASNEKGYPVTVTCPDGSATAQNVHLLDLRTDNGSGRPQSMSPSAISLSGTGTKGALSTLNYAWTLIADV